MRPGRDHDEEEREHAEQEVAEPEAIRNRSHGVVNDPLELILVAGITTV